MPMSAVSANIFEFLYYVLWSSPMLFRSVVWIYDEVADFRGPLNMSPRMPNTGALRGILNFASLRTRIRGKHTKHTSSSLQRTSQCRGMSEVEG